MINLSVLSLNKKVQEVKLFHVFFLAFIKLFFYNRRILSFLGDEYYGF